MKIISWNVNGIRSNIIDSTTAKNKSIRENLDLAIPLFRSNHSITRP